MEYILSYGLFLAKMITIMMTITIMLMMIINFIPYKKSFAGRLQFTNLGDHYRKIKNEIILSSMNPQERKRWQKKRKKYNSFWRSHRTDKTDKNEENAVLYILDFKGSMDAPEVNSLREEISAILIVAKNNDQVLLRLESGGGLVHSYGLAASQLQRLRHKGIFLTVSVDKIAASGGYMMASVANHIMATPFAVIGSIGVVAQLPNFYRFLKRHEIDIELHTAGEYKRTLTLLGENTEKGRQKFQEDLSTTHQLFKNFIHEMRPHLDIDNVATGEHWFGTHALKKGLIDTIGTSDDFILQKIDQCECIAVHYISRSSRWREKFFHLYNSIKPLVLSLLKE
ncbi:MAG: protease SohB [Candidatus Dasytiphilus stammeri]